MNVELLFPKRNVLDPVLFMPWVYNKFHSSARGGHLVTVIKVVAMLIFWVSIIKRTHMHCFKRVFTATLEGV